MNTSHSRWSVRDLMCAALGIGLLCGALFAASDLLFSRATSSPALCARMIAAMSALGAVVAVPVFVTVILIVRGIPRMPSEPILLAALAGMGVQLAFLLTLNLRSLEWLAAIPWLTAYGMYHLLRRASSREFLLRTAALCLCAIAFVPLLMTFGGLPRGTVRTVLVVALLAAPAIGVQSLAVRFRAPVFAALILGFAAMQWTGTRSRAWHENAVVQASIATGLVSDAEASSVPAGLLPSESRPAFAPPNVVLVVLDTTRADRMGCYGHSGNLTPRIDAFARECTLYEQAISSAPWTVPSHASLFTGWYTVTHGCDSEPHRWLDDGFVTLAEMLHDRGYETLALCANGYVYSCNLLQGVTRYLELDQNAGHRGTQMYTWISKGGVPEAWADQGAREAVVSLAQWLEERPDKARPFYLFVNLMEAHWPLRPPYAQRKAHLMPGMGYLEATHIGARFYGPKWTAGEKRSQRDEEAVRRLYNAEIAYQDTQLGALLDVLRAHTDFDNTLVVITADHGEHQGEHGNWDHVFSLGEALIHVPLMIRYPALFPAGRRVSGQCQLVDIVPTVFDVLATPCPVPDLPGRTLVPDRFLPREYAYAEVHPYYGHLERLAAVTGLKRDIAEFLGYLRCVRTEQYKFVWSDRGRRQLFDVSVDPQEAHDLIHDRPEVAEKLEAHMHEWWKAQPPYEPRELGASAPLGEDALRGLRGLGYVK